MVPHILGWFPMSAVWFILISQLQQAKRDVAEVSDRTIPSWVNATILGTGIIFMSFAAVNSLSTPCPMTVHSLSNDCVTERH